MLHGLNVVLAYVANTLDVMLWVLIFWHNVHLLYSPGRPRVQGEYRGDIWVPAVLCSFLYICISIALSDSSENHLWPAMFLTNREKTMLQSLLLFSLRCHIMGAAVKN